MEYQEPEDLLYGPETTGSIDQGQHPQIASQQTCTPVFLESSVSSARLRPLRKKIPPLSFRNRESPPLFEKSNVLILCVLR